MDKKPYTSLEHAIRNIVNESISPIGSDEFKGTPKAFLKPAPRIAPKKGDTHPDGTAVLAQRGAAKIGQSKSGGTMSEEEEIIDNVELEEDWKKTAKQAATDVADFGAMAPYAWVGGQKARSYMTGLKDTATMGMADTARAGVDYLAKNAAYQLGLGKGTTWETETKQQEEKKKKAQEAEPGAYKAGEITGVVGPVATGVGGVVTAGKLATGLAKGAYNLAKNPSTLKKLSTYKPLVTPQNPFAAAKDVASIGVAIEGGKTGYKAATDKDFRDYIKDKTSKPGGTGDLVKGVTKPAIDLAAPGATDAAQGKDVGRNLSRTAGGLAADVFLPTMAYDLGSQLLGGQGISGKDGWATYAYDKLTKKKKESTTAQKPIGESKKDIIKKVIKEGRAEALKDLKTLKLAPDVLKDFEAWKAAKEAEEAALKPQKTTPQTEPRREDRPDKPGNDNKPGKIVPIRRNDPSKMPPYQPFNPNKPPDIHPSEMPPYQPFNPNKPFKPEKPANEPEAPKRAEPEKPAAPVKKPEPGIPDKGRPAPTVNPVETKPKVTPTEVPALPVDPRINPKFLPGNRPAPAAEPAKAPAPAPLKAPDSLPNPAADPLRRPISQPLAEPVPAAQPAPAQKAADNAVITKPQPEKKPDKKEETKKREETRKTEEKPPKRRFGVPVPPGVDPHILAALAGGRVPVKTHLHFAQDRVTFGEAADADNIRKTIENVARPGGKTRIGKQGEIKAKIIDENAKRAAVVKQTVKDSTIIKNPKLKHPELDEN